MADTVKVSHRGKQIQKPRAAPHVWASIAFTAGVQNQDATQNNVGLMGWGCVLAGEQGSAMRTRREAEKGGRKGDGIGKNRS